MHIVYIYLYTYIYTISGLFFGSTVAALGVRMYWKSELKILICPGAVSPNDGGEIISPSSMEPVMRDGISNIPTLHCTLPGNFTHEPINESRISTKPCTKKTLLLIFTSKSFQLCIWGNFSGGLKLKTQRVLLEFTISGIYKYISHLPFGNLQPKATSHDEDRGSIHQNSRRVVVDINGQPNCIQENHTLGGSS